MREAERGDWRTQCLDSKQLWKHLQSEVAEADTTERHLMFTLKLLARLPWKFSPLLLPGTSTPHKLPLARADLQIQRKGQHFLPGLVMVQNSHTLHSPSRRQTNHKPRMRSYEPSVEILGGGLCGLDLYQAQNQSFGKTVQVLMGKVTLVICAALKKIEWNVKSAWVEVRKHYYRIGWRK